MGDWQHAFIEILLAAGASKRVCARQVGAGCLELILMRERSFATPRSGGNITTFGEREKFRIASKSSSELRI